MFGKILVFITLGLSLVAFTWALALWEHRVNWTDKQGKDGQPGLLPPLRDEFAAQAQQVPPGYFRRILSREKLEYHEYYLPLEKKWYADELQFLLTGQYRGKSWPDRAIRQLDVDPNTGQPVPLGQIGPDGEFLQMGVLKDDKGKPIADAAGPLKLQPLNKYWADYASLVTQVGEQMVRLKKAAEDDRKATILLTGERDPADPSKVVGPPGLQARLESEIVKQKKLEDERMELRPLAINARVELYILEELRQRLEERIKELEEAKRKRDTTRNDPVRD